MTQLGRRFGLSEIPGSGISCGKDGAFVGEVPLLERPRGQNGSGQWQPRRRADLNLDLSKRYGLPLEFSAKIAGLAAIARALDRGDISMRRSRRCICRFPIRLHCRKNHRPRVTSLIWRAGYNQAVSSRQTGTRRSTRAGPPEVPAALVENSLQARVRRAIQRLEHSVCR